MSDERTVEQEVEALLPMHYWTSPSHVRSVVVRLVTARREAERQRDEARAALRPLGLEAHERAVERLVEAAHNAALAGARAGRTGATEDVRIAEHRRDVLAKAREELRALVATFGAPAPVPEARWLYVAARAALLDAVCGKEDHG